MLSPTCRAKCRRRRRQRESCGASIHLPALIVTLIGSNCPAYQVAVIKPCCVIQQLPSVSYRRPSLSGTGRVGTAVALDHWSGRQRARCVINSIDAKARFPALSKSRIGKALADRIVSYPIAIFCLISYRIYRFLLKLYRAITNGKSHLWSLNIRKMPPIETGSNKLSREQTSFTVSSLSASVTDSSTSKHDDKLTTDLCQ